MIYHHTQHAPLHWMLHAIAAGMIVAAWSLRHEGPAWMILCGVAVLMLVVALSFAYLTISADANTLRIRYGPLPLFGRDVALSDITGVQADRSSLIDGWGIHWIPGRGWTFNLWGFDCVKLSLGDRTLRIGSDDVQELVSYLQKSI